MVKEDNQLNNLTVIEHMNQRILTTQQLAEFYETDTMRITQNYLRNIGRYELGVHNFKIEGEELKSFKTDYQIDIPSNTSSLMFWTEKGAFLHAKSLNTNKAWEVYEELVDTYFRVQEVSPYLNLSKELKAIFITDQKIQVVETRIEKLENTMTIDYAQQEELREIANRTVINALGGKSSLAYKMIGNKAFAELWRHYKRTMNVNSYKNTAVKDFDKGKVTIVLWKPDKELGLMIIGANTGMVEKGV